MKYNKCERNERKIRKQYEVNENWKNFILYIKVYVYIIQQVNSVGTKCLFKILFLEKNIRLL